jgi:ATP-dependent Clp protease ATP-binding subunit ClpA
MSLAENILWIPPIDPYNWSDRLARAAAGSVDDDVVKLIAERCMELESGGRMIDAILTNTVLPAISQEFLHRMMEGKPIGRVHVSIQDGK